MLLSAGAVLLVFDGRMSGTAVVCESFGKGKLSISEESVDVGLILSGRKLLKCTLLQLKRLSQILINFLQHMACLNKSSQTMNNNLYLKSLPSL